MTAVFDGHNDALGKLQAEGRSPADFLTGLPERDVDLPRARVGGLAGGLFAINAPSPPAEVIVNGPAWETAHAGAIDHAQATAFTAGAIGRAHALAAASKGSVAATDVAALDRCRAEGALAVVLHLEGPRQSTPFVRADGAKDDATPLSTLVAHVRHAAEIAGIDHVGLGSDFDGAPMPAALSDVAALPRLLDALRDDGFGADELQRIAWGNWRRVLERAWGV
jgi:microsomal dipeptidase-like Zn-dependent dipeptidase